MSDQSRWDDWNRGGGPRFPKEKVVQFMLRRFPEPAARAGLKVLDLGCGSGIHSVFLAREGFSVHATDISPVGVENTRTRLAEAGCKGPVTLGCVEQIVYPDNHFHALICIGVMECAGAGRLAPGLCEILRVLKPGAAAMVLFASEVDFRLGNGNPLELHGFTDAEVEAALEPLRATAQIWTDRYITTYQNQRIQQNEHLLTLIKGKA